MKAKNDPILVRECLEGDNKAFEALVAKYERPLFNVAYRLVNNYEDAMDIVQTAFVKAYEKLHTYNPAYQFFSWIYRIAINESINLAKKRKSHDEYESGIAEDGRRGPDDTVNIEELSEHIGAAIMRLKVDYRMVLVLKHFHDFSYQEIGEILDVPEKTVKSRLFTARQLLKGILQKEGIRS